MRMLTAIVLLLMCAAGMANTTGALMLAAPTSPWRTIYYDDDLVVDTTSNTISIAGKRVMTEDCALGMIEVMTSGIPTLQQVTDAGHTTTQPIEAASYTEGGVGVPNLNEITATAPITATTSGNNRVIALNPLVNADISGSAAIDWSKLANTQVLIVHKDGSRTGYAASANTDVARGAALSTAFAAAASGDTIYLADHTYDVSAAQLVCPASVTIIGSTRDRTKITSSRSGVAIVLADGDLIKTLWLELSKLDGTGQSVGAAASSTISLYGCKVTGDIDGILVSNASVNLTVDSCYFHTHFDCINFHNSNSSPGSLVIYNSDLLADYSASGSASNVQRAMCCATAATQWPFKAYNCRFTATSTLGSGTPSAHAVEIPTDAAAATRELHNCVLVSSVVSGTDALDIQSATGQAIICDNVIGSGTGYVPNTNGLITYVTLPPTSGVNLTNLNASNLASGTVPSARLVLIPNSSLANSATTINGTSIALGASGTITASPVGTALTSAKVWLGTSGNVAAESAITGDGSITNAGVWTNSKLNGVSYGTSPGTNTVPVVTGSNTVTYEAVPAAAGGTGQSNYATGDIPYASASTAISKLADVATGNALISGGVGTAPSYGKIGLTTHISGTLAVANGGTGATTLAANSVLTGNGTSAFGTVAPGTSGNVLTSNGTAWTSAAPAGASTPALSDVLAVGNSTSAHSIVLNDAGSGYGLIESTPGSVGTDGGSGVGGTGSQANQITIQPQSGGDGGPANDGGGVGGLGASGVDLVLAAGPAGNGGNGDSQTGEGGLGANVKLIPSSGGSGDSGAGASGNVRVIVPTATSTYAVVGGILYVDASDHNNSGTGETTLASTTLKGSTLGKQGDSVVVEGTFTEANTTTKRIRAKIGSTTIFDTTALLLGSQAGFCRVTITRGASQTGTHIASIEYEEGGTTLLVPPATVATFNENFGNDLTLAFTGTVGAGAATGDIKQKVMKVRLDVAP